jgi:hypothetical protein
MQGITGSCRETTGTQTRAIGVGIAPALLLIAAMTELHIVKEILVVLFLVAFSTVTILVLAVAFISGRDTVVLTSRLLVKVTVSDDPDFCSMIWQRRPENGGTVSFDGSQGRVARRILAQPETRGPGKCASLHPPNLSGSSLFLEKSMAENTKRLRRSRMKIRTPLILGITLLFGVVVYAQETPKIEVTGDYSYFRLNPGLPSYFNSQNLNGGGGNGAFFFTPNIALESDLQGYGSFTQCTKPTAPISGCASGNLFTYMFGPEFKYRAGKFQPLAEVLVGGAHSNLYANDPSSPARPLSPAPAWAPPLRTSLPVPSVASTRHIRWGPLHNRTAVALRVPAS